ncbi:MAG: radical SAM protein [Clostridiales bacterium]|nr:radical SAM protein [Clostridiales bacterium]
MLRWQGGGFGCNTFYGKQVQELPDDLKEAVDLIVDGGFEQDKRDTERNLVGSTNQRIIFATERYRPLDQWFYLPRPKLVEINVLAGYL